MDLKKVIIGLVVTVVVLSTGLYAITSLKFNIYTDAPHVKYDEVLDDTVTPTIYYYYQDTCHFCASIKEQVTELYLATENNDQINLKLVDVKSSLNKDAWGDETYTIENADTGEAENIKIKGTPTMIYVENGELVEYEVGSDVFKLMENVNKKYDLGLTFDPSVYGKS